MSPEPAAESSLRKPPQALEAEAAVLGAMLLDPETVTTVMQHLRPGDFYLQAHRRVYEAIHAGRPELAYRRRHRLRRTHADEGTRRGRRTIVPVQPA